MVANQGLGGSQPRKNDVPLGPSEESPDVSVGQGEGASLEPGLPVAPDANTEITFGDFHSTREEQSRYCHQYLAFESEYEREFQVKNDQPVVDGIIEVATKELGRPLEILEIGGASGRLAAYLHEQAPDTVAHYTITEPNEFFAEAARAREVPNCTVVEVSAAGISDILNNKKHDLVISQFVIQLLDLDSLPIYLDTVESSLSEDGTAIVTIPYPELVVNDPPKNGEVRSVNTSWSMDGTEKAKETSYMRATEHWQEILESRFEIVEQHETQPVGEKDGHLYFKLKKKLL